MVQLSSKDLRLDYDIAKIMLVQANFAPRDPSGKVIRELTKAEVMAKMGDVDDEEITQGYIETAATLSPAQQVIKFTIVDTQQITGSPVVPTMKLLTMQDSFLVSTMSYFLRIYACGTGLKLQDPDFSGTTDWSPVTFCDTWHGGGIAPAFDPGCGIFWFGSNISITVNKKVLIPALDCYRFYKAPQQQSVTGIYVPNWNQTFKAEHDGSVDGYYPIVPYIVIGGGRDNDVRLNLAANIPSTINPFADSGWNDTFIVQACISMRGIQMQNSTNVK